VAEAVERGHDLVAAAPRRLVLDAGRVGDQELAAEVVAADGRDLVQGVGDGRGQAVLVDRVRRGVVEGMSMSGEKGLTVPCS
jgi:hypothetical protein